jgi:hypothetical protein
VSAVLIMQGLVVLLFVVHHKALGPSLQTQLVSKWQIFRWMNHLYLVCCSVTPTDNRLRTAASDPGFVSYRLSPA